MNKKILTSLAPLLAIAALAVMPTASPALIPHWYKITRLRGGTRVKTIFWGNPVNLAQENAAGAVNCVTSGTGVIENPVPGGALGPAGVGETTSLTFTNCVEPKCEAELQTADGGLFAALGYVGKGFIATYNFPWANHLEGAGVNLPPEYEDKIGATPDVGTGQSWGLEIPPADNSEAYSEGFPAKYQAPGPSGGQTNSKTWGAPGAIGEIIDDQQVAALRPHRTLPLARQGVVIYHNQVCG